MVLYGDHNTPFDQINPLIHNVKISTLPNDQMTMFKYLASFDKINFPASLDMVT